MNTESDKYTLHIGIQRYGMGLPDWMFLLLMGLRMTHQIDTSWWWITAPLWGYWLFTLVATSIIAYRAVAKEEAKR